MLIRNPDDHNRENFLNSTPWKQVLNSSLTPVRQYYSLDNPTYTKFVFFFILIGTLQWLLYGFFSILNHLYETCCQEALVVRFFFTIVFSLFPYLKRQSVLRVSLLLTDKMFCWQTRCFVEKHSSQIRNPYLLRLNMVMF